jgi:hypothetical protein
MTGAMQMLLAASGANPGPVAGFNAWNVVAQAAAGATSTATLSFKADGTVTKSASPTDQSSNGSPAWYTPTGGTPGAAYWIRATNTGVALTGGAAVGTWLALSTDRSWTMAKTSAISTAILKFEIATDAAGGTIVFTSTGNAVTSDHNV